MKVLTTRRELAVELSGLRRLGASLGLVPTMGALHEGHRSLLVAARPANDAVAMTLFVNPLQFNDPADLERYPRDLDGDLHLAEAAGVDLVLAPSPDEMYPDGDPVVRVDPGVMGDGLEGASRPGHFVGVATVVAKLFAMFGADRAYFGEKDYEQLALIRRLVLDLAFPLEIISCPTVREPDGLALSSRNVRLTQEERAAAPTLHRALEAGWAALAEGRTPKDAEAAMAAVVGTETRFALEYAAVRDATTLAEPASGAAALRLLIAARIGAVRLIDNLGFVPTGD